MENNSFTIMPMSQQLILEAGQTYVGSINIVNPANATEDFAYKISVAPYGVSGEDYNADLETATERTQIANWLTIEEPTGKVKPNEVKEVKYTIKVPDNTPAGGQYAAITVTSDSSVSDSEGFAVNNIFEVASVIYATISGETTHAGSILENNVPGFSITTPIETNATIDNQGNIHETAIIRISATNAITGEKIFPQDEQNDYFSELIMPETTRYFTRELENLPPIGIVKVSQTIYYNGETSVAEKDLIICPIWFIVTIVVVLGAIIGGIIAGIRHHRRKKLALR